MNNVKNALLSSCKITLLMALLIGFIMPALVTAIAYIAFPTNSKGSLILYNEQMIGSELIGQPFSNPRFFWGRLSATSPAYNAAASGASHLSQMNVNLMAQANERLQSLRLQNTVPLHLISASASGLDPHLPPEAVMVQVPRVAKMRGMKHNMLEALVREHTEKPVLGFIGVEQVNILQLNLALESYHNE